jgi:DNA ligase-1
MMYDTLYKQDSTGRLRFWTMEREGSRYRMISGLIDGNPVTSGWTQATAASQDTDEAQAIFEVTAKFKHQLDREYHDTIDTVGTPKFFEPMLAKTYSGWVGSCYSQAKLDGMRCIARVEGLFTRQGQPILSMPHVIEALAPLFEADPDLVFDGEGYCHALKDDFGAIMSIARKKKPTAEQLEVARTSIQFHIYDLPSHPGNFGERFAALAAMIDPRHPAIELVATDKVETEEHLDAIYGQVLEAGYEGQMIRLDAPYEQKRSKSLLKRKEFVSDEFECVSIEAGNGNWSGLAKKVTCRLPDGRTFGAGIKGNAARAAELLKENHSIVTVRYFQLSPDGIPRFPVVTDFHGEARVD